MIDIEHLCPDVCTSENICHSPARTVVIRIVRFMPQERFRLLRFSPAVTCSDARSAREASASPISPWIFQRQEIVAVKEFFPAGTGYSR